MISLSTYLNLCIFLLRNAWKYINIFQAKVILVLIVDEKTTVGELKREVQKFNDERDWDQFHNPKDMAVNIALEAAELLEPFVYKSEKQMKEIMEGKKRQDVEDELADVFWAVIMFAQRSGIDMSEALRKKMAKSALKYPADKVRGSNKKYTEYS